MDMTEPLRDVVPNADVMETCERRRVRPTLKVKRVTGNALTTCSRTSTCSRAPSCPPDAHDDDEMLAHITENDDTTTSNLPTSTRPSACGEYSV